MTNIAYQLINADNQKHIELIADWYEKEWNIPAEKTIEKTKNLSTDGHEFQLIMTLDQIPVATGGLYNHVGLIDKEPRLRVYEHWLALVYTKPEHRGKGLGALLCKHIQQHAKQLGLTDIYLFTHTAERLYLRLGWEPLERLFIGDRDIVVMRKRL